MNYVYASLLLHSAGKVVNEENLKKVVSAVEQPDDAKIKALVAALEGVNIDEVISKAAMPVAVAATPTTAAPVQTAEKKDEGPSEEEMEKKAEQAAEGLSALFG